jgi:hypothetical protein
VDLADVLPVRALARAFDEVEYLRLDCSGLVPVPGRRGHGRLVHVLRTHSPGSTRTRSDLEERFLELCAAYGLPRPAVNTIVAGHEVDCHWPAESLVVELDGAAAHGTRAAFEHDRRRDADLLLAGQRVIRLTHRRLREEPSAVADLLRRARTRRRPAA